MGVDRVSASAANTLFDRDNLNLAPVHLHGLTGVLSDEPTGKRGHIGDGSAAGIRLILSNDTERLAATVVAQIVTLEPKATRAVPAGFACGIALATRSAK